MSYLGHYDGFSMVSALVCMVIYWIWPTMNHDISNWIVKILQTTLVYRFSILKEYWASVKVTGDFDLWVRPKGGYICLMEWVTID